MRLISSLLVLAHAAAVASAQLTVVAIDPPLNAGNSEPNTSIVVDFDRPVDAASLGNFNVYGNRIGAAAGNVGLENGDTRLRFRPLRPFFAGEHVIVGMSENLKAQDGSFLRTEGYVATFRVKAAPAPATFTQIALFTVSTGPFARIYGGQMSDLNADGFSDLAIACEVTNDVRVFLSNHDGTGSFAPIMLPTNPTGNAPSPNENADMNGDGEIDIVTSDNAGGTVSILLGNGGGTFQPVTTYTMTGSGTHGLALLDVDGDGDVDVTATGNDVVWLRRNNGNGTLAAAVSIATPSVSQDYGLAAADMNNDGITDLVVGGGSTVQVLVSNGNGTFTAMASKPSGGHCWMIQLGELNNDNKVDVSIANGGQGRGSILLGNGDGTLQNVVSTPSIAHMPATDLGDLDGDGDLDWVLSSFSGNLYQIYKNNGAGQFTFYQTLPGTQNPACAGIVDFDGDRDMDLVLFDETSDMVKLMENGPLDTQTYCYGTAVACPCGNSGVQGHGCENSDTTGGALLLAQGTASVSADSLVLNVSNLPSSSTMVFFQGTAPTPGGGSVFGDGLACAGGTVIRLGPKAGANGWASFGGGVGGDPLISIKGGVPPGGATRYYQVWYRDITAFCTPSGFNLSNGVRVTWTL